MRRSVLVPGAALVAAALLLAAVPMGQTGGWVRAPDLPWTDLLDQRAACAPLEAGAGARTITPAGLDGVPWHEPFEDANGNGWFDPVNPLDPLAHADPYTDTNLNGKWDGPWMAGYGHHRPTGPDDNAYYYARNVHDHVWARALALRCGDLTLGLVSLDTVGLFYDEVRAIRAMAPAAYDHVVVASTHTHGSVDTMGLWGAHPLDDGKDPRTMAHLKAQTVAALEDALAALEPVEARFAAERAPNRFAAGPADGVAGMDFGVLQTDLRDPVVIDDLILAAQFTALDGSGRTTATLVNWSPHPETLCGNFGDVSSDFPHYLREGLERGGFTVLGQAQEGLGGTAVYFSGAVGGMMTTLRAKVKDEAGNVLPQCSYAKTQRIGELVAWAVLGALREAPVREVPELRVQAREVQVPVDNVFLMALDALGVFDRSGSLGPVASPPLGPFGNVVPLPYLATEVDVITLGAAQDPVAQVATAPGELLPEILVGGHLAPLAIEREEDCWAFDALKQATLGGSGRARIAAANPDVPPEPVLRHHMRAGFTFLFGLANDELGYIIPSNDFTPPSVYPVFEDGTDRCGDSDHYEETVSASSVLAPVIAQNLTMLLDPAYVPPPQDLQPWGLVHDSLGLPNGVYVDTSNSGGFEPEEDFWVALGDAPALVEALASGRVPGTIGFLDSRGRDLGSDPAALAGQDVRGAWVDIDASGAYERGRDLVVFADLWLVGDDAVRETV